MIPIDAKNLLTSLLNKNPKERISARAALRHTFLTTLNPHRRSSIVGHGEKPVGSGNSPSPVQADSAIAAAAGTIDSLVSEVPIISSEGSLSAIEA